MEDALEAILPVHSFLQKVVVFLLHVSLRRNTASNHHVTPLFLYHHAKDVTKWKWFSEKESPRFLLKCTDRRSAKCNRIPRDFEDESTKKDAAAVLLLRSFFCSLVSVLRKSFTGIVNKMVNNTEEDPNTRLKRGPRKRKERRGGIEKYKEKKKVKP